MLEQEGVVDARAQAAQVAQQEVSVDGVGHLAELGEQVGVVDLVLGDACWDSVFLTKEAE